MAKVGLVLFLLMRARQHRRASWLLLVAIAFGAGAAVVLMLEMVYRVGGALMVRPRCWRSFCSRASPGVGAVPELPRAVARGHLASGRPVPAGAARGVLRGRDRHPAHPAPRLTARVVGIDRRAPRDHFPLGRELLAVHSVMNRVRFLGLGLGFGLLAVACSSSPGSNGTGTAGQGQAGTSANAGSSGGTSAAGTGGAQAAAGTGGDAAGAGGTGGSVSRFGAGGSAGCGRHERAGGHRRVPRGDAAVLRAARALPAAAARRAPRAAAPAAWGAAAHRQAVAAAPVPARPGRREPAARWRIR